MKGLPAALIRLLETIAGTAAKDRFLSPRRIRATILGSFSAVPLRPELGRGVSHLSPAGLSRLRFAFPPLPTPLHDQARHDAGG